MSEETGIKLEFGKRYRTRSGLVTPPLEKARNGTSYVFGAWIQEPQHPPGDLTWEFWLPNGRTLHDGYDHKYDLVEEVKDE